MEQKTLTRNESAELLESIVGYLIARAPISTEAIKTFGMDRFMAAVGGGDLLEFHYDWLVERLSDKPVILPDGRKVIPLDEIDKFAETMRAIGTQAKLPWYS